MIDRAIDEQTRSIWLLPPADLASDITTVWLSSFTSHCVCVIITQFAVALHPTVKCLFSRRDGVATSPVITHTHSHFFFFFLKQSWWQVLYSFTNNFTSPITRLIHLGPIYESFVVLNTPFLHNKQKNFNVTMRVGSHCLNWTTLTRLANDLHVILKKKHCSSPSLWKEGCKRNIGNYGPCQPKCTLVFRSYWCRDSGASLTDTCHQTNSTKPMNTPELNESLRTFADFPSLKFPRFQFNTVR